MTIITTRLTVAQDGTVSVSETLPPGDHEAQVNVHPAPADGTPAPPDLSWLPRFNIGKDWPPGTTFSREEIYGDDGR